MPAARATDLSVSPRSRLVHRADAVARGGTLLLPAGPAAAQDLVPAIDPEMLLGHTLTGMIALGVLAVTLVALVAFAIRTALLRRTVARRTAEVDASRAELSDALERLRAAETWYRAVLECAPVGLMVVDTTGRIRLANRTAESLFGYAPNTLAGQSVELLVPREIRGTHYRNIAAAFRDPIPRMLTGSRGVLAERQDGLVFPVDIGLNPIPSCEGPVREMAVSVADISDHRRMEREIADQLAFREVLFDAVPLPIFYKDRDGRFLGINVAYEKLFGHRRADLIGRALPELRNLGSVYSPEMIAEFHASDVALANMPRADMHMVKSEIQRPLLDGTMLDLLLWTVTFYKADGTPGGMIGVFADITQQKEAARAAARAREEAEAAAAAKSMFLANMSHEIRTPMNAVIGLAHLALQGDLPARERDYVGKIHSAGASLLGIINDILDFSKIEAGRMELEAIPFTLTDVLASLSLLIAPRATEKELEFLIAVAPDVPDALVGDPLRLGQVLINIVSNAVKFTDAGEVCLSVEVAEQSATGVTLAFAVRDTGIGLTPEQIAQLFQPFSQADGSTTRRFGGTGLGLSIAHHLVERQGGTIGVESTPGKGSIFRFTLRCGLSAPRAPHAGLALDGVPVLIVDDNATARTLMEEALSRFGCPVTTAADSARGLAALTAAEATGKPIALAFVDWKMPGQSGLAFLRAARSEHPGTRIVLVTGFGRDAVRQEAERIGIDGFLQKPVTDATLLSLLADLFEPDSAGAAVSREAPDGPLVPGARVLVAEGDPINQQIVMALLAAARITAETAATGREVLARLSDLAAPPVDLVLMGGQMPDMDGLMATRLLRAEPHLARLPVIALTAHAFPEERARMLAGGMTGYLSKPIDPEAFYRLLRTHLAAPVSESPPADAPPDPAPATAAALPPPQLAAIIATLLPLLADSDSEALDLADRERMALSAWLGDRAGAFWRALAAYDFEAATHILAPVTGEAPPA